MMNFGMSWSFELGLHFNEARALLSGRVHTDGMEPTYRRYVGQLKYEPALPMKKAEQGRKTRDILLSVARDLFGAQGFAETSLSAIVKAAGVTKGAFYHHFSGKQEIFLRVFEDVKRAVARRTFVVHREYESASGDPTSEELPPLKDLAAQSNDEVWQDLLKCCRQYIEAHTDPQVRRIVLIEARSVLTPDDFYRVEDEYGTVILRADLRRAMNRGIIKQLPLRQLARILTGTLNEACLIVANASDQSEAMRQAEMLLEHLLTGLRAD
jgi:AcrR family transcriptional regulator